MKRSLIASILGIAVSAATARADTGQVFFANYFESLAFAVQWGDTAAGHTAGQPIQASDSFSAVLFYGMGSGLSFDQLMEAPSSATLVGPLLPGAIIGGVVLLPGWTPGSQVTFGIEVYNGTDYQSSTYRSLNDVTWTEPAGTVTLYDGVHAANPFTWATIQAAYANGLNVYAVPEPGALALLGAGLFLVLAIGRGREASRDHDLTRSRKDAELAGSDF